MLHIAWMSVDRHLTCVLKDGEPMALVMARDADEAIRTAVHLVAGAWFMDPPANDETPPMPLDAVRGLEARLTVRPPNDAERHRFAARSARIGGEVSLAGFLLGD